MAGMKRFVTYIYAYEEEKKGSNVGFARIEIRGQDARIEIHLRGVYAAFMQRLRHAECICSSGKRQAGRKRPV